jgi:energy-converting hydrogenase A subunit A
MDYYPFIMIIHVDMYILLSYVLAIASSIVVGLLVGLPLLPEKPMRQSWTVSAVFPTAVIALGVLAIFFEFGWAGFYHGLDLGLAIGIITALSIKYFFDNILPKPETEDSHE